MGCIVYDGPIPRRPRGRHRRPGLPDRGLQRARRRRRLHVRLPARLAARRAARDLRRPGPMPAAPSPCRACSARRNTRPGRSSQHFLEHGSAHRALRKDATLNHIHWATTRRPQPATLMAFAIDHRAQLEEMADTAGAPRERITALQACWRSRPPPRSPAGAPATACCSTTPTAARRCSAAGEAALLDRPAGRAAGLAAARFEFGQDLGCHLAEWPVDALRSSASCFYHPGRSGAS